jgi:Bardet-Biedl syndrome 2 protein
VSETTEAEAVIGLSGVSRNRFAYSLSNGTVGVYNKGSRAWRVKSKHQVHSITAFDINSDGVPEIISGWSNGKVEVRSQTTGEVLFREMMSSSVSAVMAADFRNNGTDSLLVCGKDGEVISVHLLPNLRPRCTTALPTCVAHLCASLCGCR